MNLKYFIVFVAGMAALAGCQEASEYIPSIYITEAQRQEVKTITISQAGEKAEFTVPDMLQTTHAYHGRQSVPPKL